MEQPDAGNVNLLTCTCGSTTFFMLDVCQISSFFDKEYTTTFARLPTNYTSKQKLVCSTCGKYFKEDQYFLNNKAVVDNA
jgi:hypothetical protein